MESHRLVAHNSQDICARCMRAFFAVVVALGMMPLPALHTLPAQTAQAVETAPPSIKADASSGGASESTQTGLSFVPQEASPNSIKDTGTEASSFDTILAESDPAGSGLESFQIVSVEFTNSTAGAPGAQKHWDVSAQKNNSVQAWATPTGENVTRPDDPNQSAPSYHLFIGATGAWPAFGTSAAYFFSDMSNLATITGLENISLANTTDISFMFSGCASLTSLNLSPNTAQVTDMSSLFADCSKLTTLTWPNPDTSQVSNMNSMFSGCKLLANFDFSNFKTSKTTDMAYMFYDCASLTTLNINPVNFNTANVTDMSNMFCGCTKLSSVDVSGFNTTQVKRMTSLFRGCSSLKSLNLAHFKTSNIVDIIPAQPASPETEAVYGMAYMFYGCSSLTELNVSGFDTSHIQYMSGMFSGCASLTNLDLSNFRTENVRYMTGMFSGCASLTTLKVTSFNTSKVTDMNGQLLNDGSRVGMFSGCANLTSLDLSSFNTRQVADMNTFLDGCARLTQLKVSETFVVPSGNALGLQGTWKNTTTGQTYPAANIPFATAATYEKTTEPEPVNPTPEPPKEEPSAGRPMYRLYNKWTQEHFYTASNTERQSLIKRGWNDENIGWWAPATPTSVPVYRLYNPYDDDHHYTTSVNERNTMMRAGWRYEDVGWYSDPQQAVPLYREFNPWLKQGSHNYTPGASEHRRLVRLGWRDEGIAWYGLAWPEN